MGAATVYLGQFTWEHANAIAGRLEEAGIGWWYKQSGQIVRFFFAGDWGVRLFVEKERLEQARAIAAGVVKQASMREEPK
jgi:hypothetical protein